MAEDAAGRVHGSLPKLFGVHLSETLVALDVHLRRALCRALLFHDFLVAFLFSCAVFFGALDHLVEVFVLHARDFKFFLIGVAVEYLFALFDLVEGRLGDVDESPVDERAEVAVEKREDERRDVRAVHVRVGCNDDLVIAEL